MLSRSILTFFSIVVLTAAIASGICLDSDTYEAFAVVQTDENTESKVVIVVSDYLNIEDINKMNFLSSMAEKSHIALMNNRQPGKAGASKSKLIIGSGKKLELNSDIISGDSEGIKGDIHKVRNSNTASEYLNYIGYIGDVVNKNNGNTCFIGNADTTEQNRSSMLIAIDSSGGIDSGETENTCINDELFPYGRRTDYKKLTELYKQYLPASSFMVIETGDMERIEKFRNYMSEKTYNFYKNDVLKNIDCFIKELVSHSGFKTLIFLSTYPSKSDSEANNKLTPVVVYEAGEGGVLYSSNTRREGIILNTDIADYILRKLGYINNSAVKEFEKERPVYFLKRMNGNIVITSALRAPVLTYYAVMVILALGILFLITAVLRKKPGYFQSGSRVIIACTMISFPIAFLYIPAALTGKSPVGYSVFTAAFSVFLSIIMYIAFKEKIKVILFICLFMQIGLAADILAGSPLIKQSVLGYDPVIGARFYGIGNEYAGVFIGCSLLVFGCIQELRGKRLNRAASAVYLSACTLLLGLTFLGANFGGALAGTAGYLVDYYLVYGIKFNRRNIIIGIIILGLTAAALIFADSLGISSKSHVGGLIEETEANGFGVIISTVQRKLSMNLRLLRYTIWTKVLLCIISIISIMFYKPVKQMLYVFNRYKFLRYSWISITVSAVTGFFANDSGIVVAATAMIYLAFTMLIMCIGERDAS